MRLYVFSNMYLSPIQHGIQGLHAMGEMTLKYSTSSRPGKRFRKWLKDHKTVIVLKSGYSSTLSEIECALAEIALDDPSVPFASFREEGLENALTSVAVVLNEGSYCLAPPTAWYEGGAAELTTEGWAALLGGVACVVGALVLARRHPAFRRYDSLHPTP